MYTELDNFLLLINCSNFQYIEIYKILTIIFSVLIIYTVYKLYKIYPENWYMNPILLSSCLLFFLSYCLSNVIFFIPKGTYTEYFGGPPPIDYKVIKHTFLAILAFIAMLIGYFFLGGIVYKFNWVRKFSRSNSLNSQIKQPNKMILFLVLSISLASSIFMLDINLYGYYTEQSQIDKYINLYQILYLISNLSNYVLIISAIEFYSKRRSIQISGLFYVSSISLISLGFIAGMKGGVIWPILLIFFCKYLVSGKFPKIIFILLLAFTVISYKVIEPLRSKINESKFCIHSGLIYKIALLHSTFECNTDLEQVNEKRVNEKRANEKQVNEKRANEEVQRPFLINFLARMNLSEIGSYAIAYRDSNAEGTQGLTKWANEILMAPAYAFIPRVLWPDKPITDRGLWYTQKVLLADINSSTGMGPVSGLYLAGKYWGVILGFIFVGFLQASLFHMIKSRDNQADKFIYIALLNILIFVGDDFSAFIVTLIRTGICIFTVSFLVYGYPKYSWRNFKIS
ncbi:hypothetical protein G6687_01725 [Polynucleobacter paneuropaeus]|nr:hypothetical protein G6687_01725 [Polynucleobacter paneuropaeus]